MTDKCKHEIHGKTCCFKSRYLGYCGKHFHKNVDVCCPICLDDIHYKDVKKIICGHYFHKKCIDTWLERKPTCPKCRMTVCSHATPNQTETEVQQTLEEWLHMFSIDEIEQIILCFDDSLRPQLIQRLLSICVQQDGESEYITNLTTRLLFLC